MGFNSKTHAQWGGVGAIRYINSDSKFTGLTLRDLLDQLCDTSPAIFNVCPSGRDIC